MSDSSITHDYDPGASGSWCVLGELDGLVVGIFGPFDNRLWAEEVAQDCREEQPSVDDRLHWSVQPMARDPREASVSVLRRASLTAVREAMDRELRMDPGAARGGFTQDGAARIVAAYEAVRTGTRPYCSHCGAVGLDGHPSHCPRYGEAYAANP